MKIDNVVSSWSRCKHFSLHISTTTTALHKKIHTFVFRMLTVFVVTTDADAPLMTWTCASCSFNLQLFFFLSYCKQGQWALLGPRGKQMVLSFSLKCMSVLSLQGFFSVCVCVCVCVLFFVVVCLCFNGGNNNWCRVLQSSEQMVIHSLIDDRL